MKPFKKNKIYHWAVKTGNISIQRNNHCICLSLDYEPEASCQLTRRDTHEIVEILTQISTQIWQSSTYQSEPYTNQRHTINGNNYAWEIESSILNLSYNEDDRCVELHCQGNTTLNLAVNDTVEIIQRLEQAVNSSL